MHPNILLWSSFLIPIVLSDDFSIEIKKESYFYSANTHYIDQKSQ